MEGFSWQQPVVVDSGSEPEFWDDWLTKFREHLQILLSVEKDALAASFAQHPQALRDVLERSEYALSEFQTRNKRLLESP